ncbi:MAG: hypothetical protein DHS80DRAFT_33324 [Piptocephalis tieghemiana]|nr:MAG: hypothetical protein DHS80DRAFT_33324 [Piptocephalis tieghemiana]
MVFVNLDSGIKSTDNNNPSQTLGGSVIPVANSPVPGKNGLQGLLYDRGNGCDFPDLTDRRPLDPFKIALIHLNFTSANCTPYQAIVSARAEEAKGVIVFNGVGGTGAPPDPAPEDASVDLGITTDTATSVDFPVYWIEASSASTLIDALATAANTSQSPPLGPNMVRRVRVMLSASQSSFSGVWEFTLIIVVILLTLSFATSIAMHCHLYRVRRRQRLAREAAGINGHGDEGGQGRSVKTLLDAKVLDSFPIVTYSQHDAEVAAAVQEDGEVDPGKIPLPESRPSSSYSTVYANEGGGPLRRSSTRRSMASLTMEKHTIKEEPVIEKEGEQDRKERGEEGEKGDPTPSSLPSSGTSEEDKGMGKAIGWVRKSSSASADSTEDIRPEETHDLIITTCAVCLDDFDLGDQLRALPCGHRYHLECIDPWLTEKSSACPMCKTDFYIPSSEDENSGPSEESAIVTEPERRNWLAYELSEWWKEVKYDLGRLRGLARHRHDREPSLPMATVSVPVVEPRQGQEEVFRDHAATLPNPSTSPLHGTSSSPSFSPSSRPLGLQRTTVREESEVMADVELQSVRVTGGQREEERPDGEEVATAGEVGRRVGEASHTSVSRP